MKSLFQNIFAEHQRTTQELDWLASLDKVLEDVWTRACLMSDASRRSEIFQWAEKVRIARDNYKFSSFRAVRPSQESCRRHRFRLLTLLGNRP